MLLLFFPRHDKTFILLFSVGWTNGWKWFYNFYCYCFFILYNRNLIGILEGQTFIITTFHLLLAYFNSDMGIHILIYIAMTTHRQLISCGLPNFLMWILMNSRYKYFSVSIWEPLFINHHKIDVDRSKEI